MRVVDACRGVRVRTFDVKGCRFCKLMFWRIMQTRWASRGVVGRVI